MSSLSSKISISDVLSDLGICTNKGGFIYCPFHIDSHPSLKIYSDHWYCYQCTRHGNSVALFAAIKKYSIDKAVKVLVKKFNINSTGVEIKKPDPDLAVYAKKAIFSGWEHNLISAVWEIMKLCEGSSIYTQVYNGWLNYGEQCIQNAKIELFKTDNINHLPYVATDIMKYLLFVKSLSEECERWEKLKKRK